MEKYINEQLIGCKIKTTGKQGTTGTPAYDQMLLFLEFLV
jgi:hypothetical protein